MMPMKRLLILFALVGAGRAAGQTGVPYLSRLSATRTSPLFTTYAAPLERSAFVIDEGYQFIWNDPGRGPEYATDTGGKLCLGFRVDGEFRFALSQFSSEPVVTASYSDLMKCSFYPFPGIRTNVFFHVYSSRLAIEDVTVTNERSAPATVSAYPFFDHSGDKVTAASILPERDGFTFRHRELPDGWTTGHSVPYQEDLADVFLIDSAAASYGGYAEQGTPGSLVVGRQPSPQANYCVEWGDVYHADLSRCMHRPPTAQQVISHNGGMTEILTENAPKWGDVDPNIPGNGYQGCELGNYLNPPITEGDTFVVSFLCSATGERGVATGIVPVLPAAGGVYTQVRCTTETGPGIPQGLVLAVAPDSLSAALSWNAQSGCRYLVYRRTAATPGRFDQIVDNLTSASWIDDGYRTDSAYSYLVLAEDSAGRLSGHSIEVSGAPQARPFFSDVTNPELFSTVPPGDLKVLAFQRDLLLAPGSSSRVRIVRGVAPAGSDVNSLVAECRALRSLDLVQALGDAERVCSRIPEPPSSDPEEEMMYWSAFNMMRQCMLPPEGECSFNYNVYSREPTWGWGHAGQVFHENLSMLAFCNMDPASAQASQQVFAERMSTQPAWPAGFVPYRVGPYLDEVNYLAGEYSSSAPWFNYENREIFRVTGDTAFLKLMYPKGVAFYNFWLTDRDDDGDGLSEWGGHAFWESVRDYNVIWDLLGGWADPHSANKVEALDLNCELVMEARSLSAIAAALGKTDESKSWLNQAEERAGRINALMWDPATGFYYHVLKSTHTFTYLAPGDLKRKEQIGLLPLWAGVAGPEQAAALAAEVADSNTFCRPYGMPLLAHNDPYGGYDAHSVYPEWNYLVFRGLLDYGYRDAAKALAARLFAGVIQTLKDHHDFYESYFCDQKRPSDSWLHTYIWTGIVARMLIDLGNPAASVGTQPAMPPPEFALEQNYPNPFNPSTTLRFRVPAQSMVTLTAYDILGREVSTLVHAVKAAGEHAIAFDSSGLSSGVYLVRLNAGRFTAARKMILLR